MSKFKKIALSIGIIVIAIGAYVSYSFYSKSDKGACIQDAFQCPDGSFVGRTGPECKLKACTNAPYFDGILQQSPAGFALIMGSPDSNSQEVSYRMPIDIKVTNVIGTFVGKRVRVYGTFTEGANLKVDHLEELPGTAGDATMGEVKVGGSVFINGIRITLNKIVQDSRCPANTVCVAAGRFTANITAKSDTDKETFDISLNAPPHPLDSFKISIASIKPGRIANKEIKTDEYVIGFRVNALAN